MLFFDQKFTIAFATSGITAVDMPIPSYMNGRIIGAKIKGHTWPVVADGASAASGGVVKILDPDGDATLTFAEVLTGSTTRISLSNTTSADGLLIPGGTLRYQFSAGNKDNRSVSGAATSITSYPSATVVLYLEQSMR